MRFILNLIPCGFVLAVVSLAFGWGWAVAAVVAFFLSVAVIAARGNKTV